MRLTFLMPADDLTGGNRVVATYAKCLQKRGYEVLVISNAPDATPWRKRVRALLKGDWKKAMDSRPKLPGHIANSGVPHQVMQRKRPIRASDVPDADFVVATWWETADWMHSLPTSKGRHVHLIQGYEVWGAADQIASVHRVLQQPNLKIAISNALKQTIEEGLGPLGVQVVPNAVDLAQFNAPPRERNKVPRVGFIYSQAAIKGADVCTAACELARQKIPDLEVLSFGSDALLDLRSLPLGAHYIQRPSQDALSQLYAQCDVWLFGSRLDSFGLPILEAMACRTPVVGVPIGAAPELLPEGGGELVPIESPQAMADALVHLLSEPASAWRRRSLQAHTRAHAYSWDDATKRFLALLNFHANVVAKEGQEHV
jgi:glycosyltransferase involved in cell wall biosynthesis